MNADAPLLCPCDQQMTSSRQWALNRGRPLLRGRAPQLVSTGPDWASTQQAQLWICPSSAPRSRALSPVAPLCSPRVRDHTPWTSLKCAPVWSPLWHAETRYPCRNLDVSGIFKPMTDPGCWKWLPLSVSSFICSSCNALKGWTQLEKPCLSPQIKETERGSLFRNAD